MTRLQDLERRLQFDPAPFVFAQLADEYCRAGRCDDAIACCRRVLDPHPTYFTARVVLGRALAALGRFQEAAIEFEQVLTSAPDHLTATKDLADVYERLHRPAEALAGYRRALDLSRDDRQLQSAIARLSSSTDEIPPAGTVDAQPPERVDLDAVLERLGHPNQPVPPLVETLLSHPERLLDDAADRPTAVRLPTPPTESGDALARLERTLRLDAGDVVPYTWSRPGGRLEMALRRSDLRRRSPCARSSGGSTRSPETALRPDSGDTRVRSVDGARNARTTAERARSSNQPGPRDPRYT